jgi:hypothetical protein
MDRVRTHSIAATGAVLLAIDAVTVVANAQDKTRFHKHPRIGLDLALGTSATKPRPLCDDLTAGAATQLRCSEHLLPSQDRLFDDVFMDLALEPIIGPGVSGVGHASIPVTELLGQGKEAGTIAQRREPGKGLASLVRGQ